MIHEPPEPEYREVCYACRRPKALCLCPSEPPLRTRTRVVLLMHPMEYKREKCATGRLTCLNLANSEMIPGLRFDENPRYRALVDDPANYPVLLYPGKDAFDLSSGGFPSGELGGRRLVVFLVDSTWACAKSILRESPGLLSLPCVKFTPTIPSRYVIKRQPAPNCLSTIEATHELLLALERSGLDEYTDKERLLAAFFAMRDYQIDRIGADRNPRQKKKWDLPG
ncbi:MAG: DTW domain-containing protein [Spirochaetes bacterium]|nr:DTW domain-containing protein [Spirochaetota bacterium]MBU1079481.1 DTW domain-containing protein [Spirochaetota bacterium]